jgi:hypothetical protein
MDLPSTPKTSTLSAELKEIINKRNILTTRTRIKGIITIIFIYKI